MVKRVPVVALLLALLGVGGCGDDEPAPVASKRIKVDYERPAPAWAVWQAARAAEEERGAAISEERKRLTRVIRKARDEPAVRKVLGSLSAAWRDQDPAGFGSLALHALVQMNGQSNGLGDAKERIQREFAFETLTMKDKLLPSDEAGLAEMLASALSRFPYARRKEPKQQERFADLRTRIAPHWVQAWSRLEDAVDDGWVPQSTSVQPPGPDEDITWMSGWTPCYLLDAVARVAYDDKLERWIEAGSRIRAQSHLRDSLKRHRLKLRSHIVRAYGREPHDHSGLRKLLNETSIPAEDVSSILRDVGAQE